MLRFVFVKQPYASSITKFHNNANNVPQCARFSAFASALATIVARSAGSSRVDKQEAQVWTKITRRAFFLGKCHRVAMVACLNNVKLSVVLPRQDAASEPRNAS